jgi:hypothetical protein
MVVILHIQEEEESAMFQHPLLLPQETFTPGPNHPLDSLNRAQLPEPQVREQLGRDRRRALRRARVGLQQRQRQNQQ